MVQRVNVDWLPEWERLEVANCGTVLPTMSNIVAFLSRHPEWKGHICYEEFTHRIVVRGRVPVRGTVSRAPWDDYDELRTVLWLSEHMREPRRDQVRAAVVIAAQGNRFNALTRYLDHAADHVWDGQPRLDQWTQMYLGACAGPEFGTLSLQHQQRLVRYHTLAGPMWMIGAVRRAFAPGVRVDHMMILEGAQGTGKSTALRILGEEYFSDATLDLESKDAKLLLSRFWIIEMAELEGMSSARVAQMKSFLTQHVDHYRPPYGAAIREAPRHCVFAGTVNDRRYLRDPTGNRRFLPISVGRIDLERLSRERDQLWGEATARYRRNERHWPDEAESPLFEEQQSSRLRQHRWEGAITAYVDGEMDGEVRQRVTSVELLDRALRLEPCAWPGNAEEQVGKIMSRLGWERKRMSQSPRSRYYERRQGLAECEAGPTVLPS